MARLFTSGLNTADIEGERKINRNTFGIFIAAAIFFLIVFLLGAAYYTVQYNRGAGQEIQQPEGDRRAQP